ncbi:hypothetical protein KFK09_008647 [Dendrobium nobile]|uniref:Uncharacterized protein n=1 Tax=Dendrobium nobile TaxID=94219 RepID=A0A8T3BQ36_DENNO|nr:hypothetical protein KFK09_008647 [Dendrobium nobile]
MVLRGYRRIARMESLSDVEEELLRRRSVRWFPSAEMLLSQASVAAEEAEESSGPCTGPDRESEGRAGVETNELRRSYPRPEDLHQRIAVKKS